MANINLAKKYERRTETRSRVDSSQKLSTPIDAHNTYADLDLDLGFTEVLDRALNALQSNSDLRVVEDEQAVLSSLRNIMRTTECTRLLNPEVDVDVRGFLFEPLTEAKGFFIGYQLTKLIPLYEPRVKIQGVHVQVNYDDKSYYVEMSILIPSLNKTVEFSHVFGLNDFSIDY